MKIEELFNRQNIVDMSFFNFNNAVTAAYFADEDLRILKVNDNFKAFVPVLGTRRIARRKNPRPGTH